MSNPTHAYTLQGNIYTEYGDHTYTLSNIIGLPSFQKYLECKRRSNGEIKYLHCSSSILIDVHNQSQAKITSHSWL